MLSGCCKERRACFKADIAVTSTASPDALEEGAGATHHTQAGEQIDIDPTCFTCILKVAPSPVSAVRRWLGAGAGSACGRGRPLLKQCGGPRATCGACAKSAANGSDCEFYGMLMEMQVLCT